MAKQAKSLGWYFRRLSAMGPKECLQRVRTSILKRGEMSALTRFANASKEGMAHHLDFPVLPNHELATPELIDAIQKDAASLAAGNWILLHGHSLQLSLPPEWQKDYLGGGLGDKTLRSRNINYRALNSELDPRVVWEVSRWTQFVRMSQACFLGEAQHTDTVLNCLQNWVEENPTGYALNWTSPMEPGLRLINFVWIHALLTATELSEEQQAKLNALAKQIVPDHVWWVWRYHSYGSSANNHLLGELAGLILAQARWPGCSEWSASIDELAAILQSEILRQFAADGGNNETSLHYHLFAFELCWQALIALKFLGKAIDPNVTALMTKAGRFFVDMVSPLEPWDYGDSDDAHVTPFYTSEKECLGEWVKWLSGDEANSFSFWLGGFPSEPKNNDQMIAAYPDSGYSVFSTGAWKGRIDASPLGFGSIAAHGQLDALHLSLWHTQRAVVIDPGTGSYFGQSEIREHLVSAAAHNGPVFENASLYPARHGAFLWGPHHKVPRLSAEKNTIRVSMELDGNHQVRRQVVFGESDVIVEDSLTTSSEENFAIHWQFAPGINVLKHDDQFSWEINGSQFRLIVSSEAEISLGLIGADEPGLQGICSPFYKKLLKSSVVRISGKCLGSVQIRSSFAAQSAA